ncbi:MAG: 2-oxoglutarate dehydrogenase E1 subunit family protein, partial [Pirellulales bacterium]
MSIIDSIDSAGTASLAFLEELFEHYQRDPASVPADWRGYFEALQAGVIAPVAARPASGPTATSTAETRAAVGEGGVQANGSSTNGHAVVPPSAKLVAPDGIATAHAVAIANGEVRLPEAPAGEAMPLPLPPVATGTAGEERVAFLQDRVDQLVRAYRVRGHLMAEIDPLGRPRPGLPELDPAFYHLTEEDMDRSFSTDTIE